VIETIADLPSGTLGFRGSGKITSDEYRKMKEPIYSRRNPLSRLSRR
jgi:hypothetical protein